MVISTVNQVVYNGDGVTTAFPFTFRIIEATDIKLLLIDADGAETDITADYYVDTVNNTVYYPGYAPGAEPPAEDQPPKVQTGQKLVVYREIPITQEKDLGEKWPFAVIELGLDKLTMILQQIFDWWGRTLKISQGGSVDGFDTNIYPEAGKVIAVNDTGDGFEAKTAMLEENNAWNGKGMQIKSVAEPTDGTDVATKNYVANYGDGNFMKLQDGGEGWEGRNLPIHNVTGPVQVNDAATKDYVDRILNGFVLSGDSRTVPFDNVAQMKASDIEAGQIAFTLGYSDVNDGGAGVYNIRTATVSDVDDGGSVIILDNGNVAELIVVDQVTLEQFGARGDGTTDDTTPIDNAIRCAIAKGVRVQLLAKTYIMASRNIHDNMYEIPNAGGLWINGLDKESVIKRKNNSVTADNQSLLYIRPASTNTADIGEIHFSNLMINSNATNNTPADSGFAYEHCADVRIAGYSATHVRNVIIENVWATDGVADHFWFPNTSGVGDNFTDTVTVRNFFVDVRNRTRSDLCFTGYVPTVDVADSKFVVLEYEYNVSTADRTNLFVANTQLERIDLAGGVKVEFTNLVVTKKTYLSSVLGTISASRLMFHSTNKIRATKGLVFSDCILTVGVDADTLVVQGISVDAETDVLFRDCRFEVDYTGESAITGGVGVHFETTSENVKHRGVFDNCTFDERIPYCVYIDRMVGDFTLQNMVQRSNNKFINIYSTNDYPSNVLLKNISILNGTMGKFQISSSKLTFDNVVCYGLACAMGTRENSAWANYATVVGKRTIIISAPITSADRSNMQGVQFKGDTFINTAYNPNEPEMWERTSTYYSSSTSTAQNNLVVKGKSVGDTASRPTCKLTDGFEYFDTDLKKPIYRSGSDWVDATGTVVV